MNTEQELRPCKACGQPEGHIAANGGWLWGECWNCDYRTSFHRSDAEAREEWNHRDEQAEVVAWQVTQYDPNGRLYDSVSLVRGSLPDYYRTERWGSSGHAMWEVIPLYRAPPAVAAGGVTEERVEAAARVIAERLGFNPKPGLFIEHREMARAALTAALAVGDEGIREDDTIRVCPERDARCPHGMSCPYNHDRYRCDMIGSRAALKDTTHAE